MATSSHPVQVQPQGCTNLKLRQLMRRVAQHYDAEMAATGLKTTQYSLLSCVMKIGPARPMDIAAALRMDASTLTRNLKPLEQAGLVQVEPGVDGRSRVVTLTAAGREKRHEAQRRWRTAQEGLNALLGPASVLALHTLIDDCMAKLSPAEPGDEDV